MKKLIFIACLFYSISSIAASSIDTTLSFKRIGHIAISPDGQQIAYTTSQITSVPEGKKRDYFLSLKDKSGSTIQLISGQHISTPTWSPDGKFLAYFIKKDKVEEIKIYGVENRVTTTFISWEDRNISSFKWSPDGNFIAFVADDEKNKKSKLLTPIDISKDYTNSRIYLKAVNAPASAPEPITSNQISITQVFTPLLDSGFDWSPDGRTIAFAYQPRVGAQDTGNSKIAILHLDTKQVTEVPYMKDHAGSQPIFSPDGKWVVFHSNLTNVKSKIPFYTDPNNNGQLCVTDTLNFSTYCLSNTFNENPFVIGWSASGHSVYAFDWYKTDGPQIYELDLNSTIPAKLISTTKGFIEPMTLAFNGTRTTFAFGFETPTHAPEIYKANPKPFKLVQVTHLQTLSKELIGKSEVIRWKSKDNMKIEGILITPAKYDPKKKYPLLVDIHGGPAGAMAQRYIGGCDEFGNMILPACPKTLLDMGFIIFQPNYRGSSGYGKSFRGANVTDFGGGDYQDIMTGIDRLIDEGFVDSDHLALFGWSYGGYMTAWSITQTNRFKAAVEGSGLTDLVSFTGTTDIPEYLPRYLDATLWDDKKLYLQRSPIFFTKNVTTPLLILHGKEDLRVPISQSYEFYSALKLQNKPVQMYVFPGQEHILTDGNIIYNSLVITNDWLKRALPK